MFQQCPICKGTGKINEFGVVTKCPTCKGTRIISQLTGLPPAVKEEETISPPNFFMRDKNVAPKEFNTKKEINDIKTKCSEQCFCDGSCQINPLETMRNRDTISDFLEQLFKA